MSPTGVPGAIPDDVIIAGIDLSSQPAHTGVARLCIDPRARVVRVEEVAVGADDEQVHSAVTGADRCGVDVPFGWPAAFADLIAAHRTDTAPAPLAVGPSWHHLLARRATDRYVHDRTGLTPLSVSTDRIAYPALRWAHLAARLRDQGMDTRRDGSGPLCEVYPAAALRRWGLPHRGYKKPAGQEVRGQIIEGLCQRTPWLDWNGREDLCVTNDDALDAVLCAIIALQVRAGRYEPPPPDLERLAAEEGWICLPTDTPQPPW